MVSMPRQRHALELAIRVVDLVVYAAVFTGGVYALVAAPGSITDSLENYYGLVLLWSALLCAGGLAGLIGRLSRYWLVEVPATIAAAFGIAIYLAVLSQYLFLGLSVAVVFMMAVVALAFMIRRWLELQIFATEPGASWRKKLADSLRRKTQDVAQLH